MDERTIITISLYNNEIYFLTIDCIYARWSSSLSDVQFFYNSEEAKKILELNFDTVYNSLGNNSKFIDKIKISNIVILGDNNNYKILSEEYFMGGYNKDEQDN